MPRQHRRGAIELFGDDETHQHMWKCEWSERPALVGAGEDFGGVAIGAADQDREVAAVHAPVRELFGELFAGPRLAAAVEGDDVDVFRECGEDGDALIGDRANRVAAFAPGSEGNLDEFKREFVGQAFAVFGEAVGDPSGHALADGDQAGFHRAE